MVPLPLVSIIIPVYNAEEYLERCIDSVVSQSYCNIEIILVNDGSLDNSGEICRNYVKRYDNIVLLSQDNQGPAMARNRGLSAAHGEYIQFVDADDWIKPAATQKLLDGMTEHGADMAVCSFIRTDGEKETEINLNISGLQEPCRQLMEFARGVPDALLRFGSTGNKMYKKCVIDKFSIVFENTRQANEDAFFNLEYVKHITGVYFLNEPLYYYFVRPGRITMTTKYRPNAYEMNNRIYSEIEKMIHDKLIGEKRRMFNRHYLDKTLIVLRMLARENTYYTREELIQKFSEIALSERVKDALSDFAPQGSQENSAIELLKTCDGEKLYEYAIKGNNA